MERIIIILSILIFHHDAFSQLVFDRSVFPKPGDSLTFFRDIIEPDTRLGQGTNQVWDLSYLETPIYQTKTFEKSPFYKQSSQAGKVFSFGDAEIKYLYERHDDGIREIGFLLPGAMGGAKSVPVFYDKTIPLTPGSLAYGQQSRHKVSFEYELDKQALPANLQSDLTKGIRRIRISGSKTIERLTDAWGSLFLPGEILQANRVRVSEKVIVRIYDAENGKLIPFFDDNMISQVCPFRLKNQYYEFWSREHSSVTAKIQSDPSGKIRTIEYQPKVRRGTGINLNAGRNDFVLSPNPTYNIAKVYISNQKPGKYALAIFNIIGKKLWHQPIEVDGPAIIKENFGFLPKGTYLLSLMDENGNIIRTIRLMIISV